MHDHTRAPADTSGAPTDLDLRQLRIRAKELRRRARGGNPTDLALLAQHHPVGRKLAENPSEVTLRDAQLTLARSYGFAGWHALVTVIGQAQVADRDLHRWFGVEFNNEVWDLLDDGVDADSPQSDRDLVLYGAYASARHWHECGTRAHAARGEHLISRAALAVGSAQTALHHARRCLQLIQDHPEAMADWDAPFAHEALARALAATGDLDGAAEHRATAVALTGAVGDPGDRAILEDVLARGPWFGLS